MITRVPPWRNGNLHIVIIVTGPISQKATKDPSDPWGWYLGFIGCQWEEPFNVGTSPGDLFGGNWFMWASNYFKLIKYMRTDMNIPENWTDFYVYTGNRPKQCVGKHSVDDRLLGPGDLLGGSSHLVSGLVHPSYKWTLPSLIPFITRVN